MYNKCSAPLGWFLIAAGCLLIFCWQPLRAAEVSAAGAIPVFGGVEHFSGSPGQSATWVSFVVGEDFSGPLPEGIEKVSVSVNGETLPLTRSDFTYFPERRLFWASLPGTPEIGDYAITVTGQNNTGITADRLTTLISIVPPKPDNASPNSKMPCTTNRPVFAWRPPEADVPLYYRLEIAPAGGRPVYRSNDARDMLSVKLLDGILEPATQYRWRVRASDAKTWREVENRSQTPWLDFQTADRFAYDYHVPEQGGDGWVVDSMLQSDMNPKPVGDLCERIINREIENIHSLLIVKEGRLVCEEYFYGYERDRKHLIASVTKSVVSLLVGIAIDRGLIPGVGKKVMGYFPEYISGKNISVWEPVRLYHLLTMSAGLDWDALSYPREDPRQTSHQMYDSPDPIAFVFSREAVAAPGQVYNYNSGLTMLLGEIVKRATAIPADRFAAEHLFDALGISDFAWDRFDNGVIAADGGLFLRPRDMAKIGLLVLNQGQHKGLQVVPASWVAESTRAHIPGNGVGYGYQWRRANTMSAGTQIEVVYASGLGGQKIFILPALDAVAVITSKTLYNTGGGSTAEHLFLEYVLPALMNVEPTERKIVAVPADRLQALIGRYESIATRYSGSVLREDGKLFLKVPGKGTTELYFTGPDQCFGRMDGVGDFGIQAVFKENGQLDHIRFSLGLKSYRYDKVE